MLITREQFLTRSAAALVGATLPGLGARRAAGTVPRRLLHRGVGYEVADGATPDTSWDADRMRHDLAAISRDLHADTVSVFGNGVERLLATTEEAVGHGLHVWLQPRLGDVPRAEILEHLGEIAAQAQTLRAQGASIDLSVGAEFVLFVPGIVPGGDAVERVRNLLEGNFDPERMQRRLTAFIADAARTARSAFGGRVSYAAAVDDVVDWTLFDVVGIDYYSNYARPERHARELRRYTRLGKPVAIMEYGCCTYRGAARRGGMGWDVLDESGERLREHVLRSEAEQARYIMRMLAIFEAAALDSAMVYQFVTPDAPHRRSPRLDLDRASYAIVKPIWGSPDAATPNWHWEPKLAFHELARELRRGHPSRSGRLNVPKRI